MVMMHRRRLCTTRRHYHANLIAISSAACSRTKRLKHRKRGGDRNRLAEKQGGTHFTPAFSPEVFREPLPCSAMISARVNLAKAS